MFDSNKRAFARPAPPVIDLDEEDALGHTLYSVHTAKTRRQDKTNTELVYPSVYKASVL